MVTELEFVNWVVVEEGIRLDLCLGTQLTLVLTKWMWLYRVCMLRSTKGWRQKVEEINSVWTAAGSYRQKVSAVPVVTHQGNEGGNGPLSMWLGDPWKDQYQYKTSWDQFLSTKEIHLLQRDKEQGIRKSRRQKREDEERRRGTGEMRKGLFV